MLHLFIEIRKAPVGDENTSSATLYMYVIIEIRKAPVGDENR